MTRFIYNPDTHRYWYGGKQASGATSVAGIGIDRFGVDLWRKRLLAVGLAGRPDIAEMIVAHFDDDKMVDKLSEDAMDAAKSNASANVGTAVHRHLERVDLNEDIIETPLSRALRAAWELALERAGLEIVKEYVERFVIWPDEMICGRLDRIVWSHSRQKHCILDIKNGKTVAKYPHSVAVQMDIYARASLMAGEMQPHGENGSLATEEFIDMTALDIDQEVAYVVRTSGVADGECAEVLEVDIALGHKALTKVVLPALKWRKVVAERLMRPIASAPIESTNGEPWPPQASASTASNSSSPLGRQDASPTTPPSTPSASVLSVSTTTAPSPSPSEIDSPPTTRQFQKDIETLRTNHEDGCRCEVCANAPPEEGPDVSDSEVEALRRDFDACDVAEKLWLSVIGFQCVRAGYTLNMAAGPTRRRWTIAKALLALAHLGPTADDTHEQTVRALLGVVIGDDIRPVLTTGQVVAALSIDEAQRLMGLAGAMGTDLTISWDHVEAPCLHGPAVEAARAS